MFFYLVLLLIFGITDAAACLDGYTADFPSLSVTIYPMLGCLFTGLLLALSIKYSTRFCDKFSILKNNEKFPKIAKYEKYFYLVLLDLLLVYGVALLANVYFDVTYNTLNVKMSVNFAGFSGVCILFCVIFCAMWQCIKFIKNNEKSMTLRKKFFWCILAMFFGMAVILNVYFAITEKLILNYVCIACILSAFIYAHCLKNKIYIKMAYSGLIILLFLGLTILLFLLLYRIADGIIYDFHVYDPCPLCDCM